MHVFFVIMKKKLISLCIFLLLLIYIISETSFQILRLLYFVDVVVVFSIKIFYGRKNYVIPPILI